MNDHALRRSDRATRVQSFGVANAADFAPGSKAALLFPALDSILEKLLGVRVGQLRTPVGKPALLDALFADFKDIARTSRAIALEEPGFSSAAYRFPADYTEATATTHADSLLTLLEDDAVLRAQFIAFEMPADFVADLRTDRDALDGSNSGKHSDNFEGLESTAAIETLLGEAQDLITRLDTVMHNKYSRNPDKLLAWKSAARVERAGRKAKPDGTTPTPSAV
jgi:hypothetical protein